MDARSIARTMTYEEIKDNINTTWAALATVDNEQDAETLRRKVGVFHQAAWEKYVDDCEVTAYERWTSAA